MIRKRGALFVGALLMTITWALGVASAAVPRLLYPLETFSEESQAHIMLTFKRYRSMRWERIGRCTRTGSLARGSSTAICVDGTAYVVTPAESPRDDDDDSGSPISSGPGVVAVDRRGAATATAAVDPAVTA